MEESKENVKEEKIKKDHTMWFIILIGILVIFLGATIVYTMNLRKELTNIKLESANEIRTLNEKIEDNNNNNTIINENTTLEETNKNENKKELLKKDASKELVYTQISKKSSKDGYSFEIPYVNINSEYAEQINKKIYDGNINEIIKDATSAPDSQTYASYKAYVNNSILSLVIDNGEGFAYNVYNIDIYTGKKVSNNEILKSKNISEKKLIQKVGDLSVKKAKENNKDLSNNAIKDTKKINSNMKEKVFLDKQNNINVIAEIRTEAQYDPIEVIINTEL